MTSTSQKPDGGMRPSNGGLNPENSQTSVSGSSACMVS